MKTDILLFEAGVRLILIYSCIFSTNLLLNNNMSVAVKWDIKKFATLIDRQWSKPICGEIFLRLHYDQALVCSKNVIYETILLRHDVTKGYIQDNVLICYYEIEKKVCGVKIMFSCGKNEINALVKAMSNFCIIQDFKNLQANDDNSVTLSTFQEMVKSEMKRCNNYVTDGTLFPADFPFEEFLKICIVDPNFPKIVDQVEKSLHQYLH